MNDVTFGVTNGSARGEACSGDSHERAAIETLQVHKQIPSELQSLQRDRSIINHRSRHQGNSARGWRDGNQVCGCSIPHVIENSPHSAGRGLEALKGTFKASNPVAHALLGRVAVAPLESPTRDAFDPFAYLGGPVGTTRGQATSPPPRPQLGGRQIPPSSLHHKVYLPSNFNITSKEYPGTS